MTITTAPVRLWQNTRYVIWLISDTSKGLAASLFGFAIPLLALIVTDDPAQAGVIAGVAMVARVLATLGGGVLADRHRRLGLMLIGSLLGIVLSAAFLLLALGDALTFTTLLVIDVLLAARTGLFDPAGETAVKEIVPDEAMGRAQATNQARDAALQLTGGPLGGLLLGAGGWLIGLAMTICHAVAALTAWMLGRSLTASDPHRRGMSTDVGSDERSDPTTVVGPDVRADADAAPTRPNALAEIREGFAWLFSRPDLRGVLLITTIINLGFNAAMATVLYSLQQAGHPEVVIGVLSASAGAVMLAGALLAPMLVARIGAGTLTVLGLSCAALGAAALSLVTEPWAIAVVLGAAIALLPALNAAMMGYFMVATPTERLGRANSAAGVLAMGAMPLAPMIAGFGLAWAGREATILLSAGVCGVSVLLALGNRALRALPPEAGWAAHARQFE